MIRLLILMALTILYESGCIAQNSDSVKIEDTIIDSPPLRFDTIKYRSFDTLSNGVPVFYDFDRGALNSNNIEAFYNYLHQCSGISLKGDYQIFFGVTIDKEGRVKEVAVLRNDGIISAHKLIQCIKMFNGYESALIKGKRVASYQVLYYPRLFEDGCP